MITFPAKLIKNPKLDGAYVEIPAEVLEVFGGKRVKVKAHFDGVPYRGSIVTMGGQGILGVTKAIREQIGKQPGDTIDVVVERDTEERIIAVPDDVAAALTKAGVFELWNALSFSHQRQHMNAIADAKKEETRERRINKMIEMLKQ